MMMMGEEKGRRVEGGGGGGQVIRYFKQGCKSGLVKKSETLKLIPGLNCLQLWLLRFFSRKYRSHIWNCINIIPLLLKKSEIRLKSEN